MAEEVGYPSVPDPSTSGNPPPATPLFPSEIGFALEEEEETDEVENFDDITRAAFALHVQPSESAESKALLAALEEPTFYGKLISEPTVEPS